MGSEYLANGDFKGDHGFDWLPQWRSGELCSLHSCQYDVSSDAGYGRGDIL